MAATHEDMVKVLDALAVHARWAIAMSTIGQTETNAFALLAKSRKAMKADDKSWLYFEWREQLGFFHQHATNARIEHKMSTEAVIRQEIRDGLEVKLYDGSGKPVWMVDPVAAARNFRDAEEAKMCGFDDWPYLHTEDGKFARIQATKRELLPATTRNMLLSTIPDYTPHSTVDVRQTNVVHVQHSYLKPPTSPQAALPAPQDTDSALVKDLKEKLRLSIEGKLGEKQPTGKVEIFGRSTAEIIDGRPMRDQPDRVSRPSDETPKTLADHPRAYTVPKLSPPKGPITDYGRPAEALDQASRGRGIPPAGGFKVS